MAQARMDVGKLTQLEVSETRLALTQARTNRIQALHDYNIAQARLQKAVGVAETFEVMEIQPVPDAVPALPATDPFLEHTETGPGE